MLDCFRTGGANNPETFIAAVAAVLSRYPDEVVYAVTGSTGLPLQLTWMPSVKEVHDACEAEMAPIYRREREAKILAETLASRNSEPDRSNRPSREELQAKHGRNWGLNSLDEPVRKPKPAPTWHEVEEYYRARPGRLQWLADRKAVMRGEIADTPEPESLATRVGRTN